MTDRPVLYSFRRCPYAMRARLALIVSGKTCEIREVKLSAKPAELFAASSKATLPVLVLPNGQVIDESLEVMHWALVSHDPENWLEREDSAMIAANDGPFKHHLDHYKYPERCGSDQSEHRLRGLELLSPLEKRLVSHAHLCGDRMGITDAAIQPFVRQFAAVDQAWFDARPLPRLQAWLASFLSSPLFTSAMIRLPPWKPEDEPCIFPVTAR